MHFNFKEEVILNESNFFTANPIDKKDVQRRKINGRYIYEKFYLIDFLDIKDNSYVISSFGRIFSLALNKELKATVDSANNNYTAIMLRTNSGKDRKFPIHHLVARAFIKKTTQDKKMNRVYIHHKNWDNEYNYYWNLEWRSPMEIIMIGRAEDNLGNEEEIIKIVDALIEKDETIGDIFDIIGGQLSKFKIIKIKNRMKNKEDKES